METVEKLLLQIFERKRWIVEQVKHQTLLYDQHLASKCIIDGIPPPSWLMSSSFHPHAPDPSELAKEELISGLLLPLPQPSNPYSTSHQSIYKEPAITIDYGVSCNAVGEGFDTMDGFSVLPEIPDTGAGCSSSGVPDQDPSVTSPEERRDSRITDNNNELVLSRLQRSKSRQKALEVRKSAQASKSNPRDEDVVNACASRLIMHSDYLDEPVLGKPVDGDIEEHAAEEANIEQNVGNSIGPLGSQDAQRYNYIHVSNLADPVDVEDGSLTVKEAKTGICDERCIGDELELKNLNDIADGSQMLDDSKVVSRDEICIGSKQNDRCSGSWRLDDPRAVLRDESTPGSENVSDLHFVKIDDAITANYAAKEANIGGDHDKNRFAAHASQGTIELHRFGGIFESTSHGEVSRETIPTGEPRTKERGVNIRCARITRSRSSGRHPHTAKVPTDTGKSSSTTKKYANEPTGYDIQLSQWANNSGKLMDIANPSNITTGSCGSRTMIVKDIKEEKSSAYSGRITRSRSSVDQSNSNSYVNELIGCDGQLSQKESSHEKLLEIANPSTIATESCRARKMKVTGIQEKESSVYISTNQSNNPSQCMRCSSFSDCDEEVNVQESQRQTYQVDEILEFSKPCALVDDTPDRIARSKTSLQTLDCGGYLKLDHSSHTEKRNSSLSCIGEMQGVQEEADSQVHILTSTNLADIVNTKIHGASVEQTDISTDLVEVNSVRSEPDTQDASLRVGLDVLTSRSLPSEPEVMNPRQLNFDNGEECTSDPALENQQWTRLPEEAHLASLRHPEISEYITSVEKEKECNSLHFPLEEMQGSLCKENICCSTELDGQCAENASGQRTMQQHASFDKSLLSVQLNESQVSTNSVLQESMSSHAKGLWTQNKRRKLDDQPCPMLSSSQPSSSLRVDNIGQSNVSKRFSGEQDAECCTSGGPSHSYQREVQEGELRLEEQDDSPHFSFPLIDERIEQSFVSSLIKLPNVHSCDGLLEDMNVSHLTSACFDSRNQLKPEHNRFHFEDKNETGKNINTSEKAIEEMELLKSDRIDFSHRKFGGDLNSAFELMPEMEGFTVQSFEEESYMARNRTGIENLDLPNSTLERASFVEQLCKSACSSTPWSHFSATFEPNRPQYLSPTRYVDGMGFVSTLTMHGNTTNQIDTCVLSDSRTQLQPEDSLIALHVDNQEMGRNTNTSEKSVEEPEFLEPENEKFLSYTADSPQRKSSDLNSALESMPELEGFTVQSFDEESSMAGGRIGTEILDLPNTAIERASSLQQLYKSACLSTPWSHFSGTCKLNKPPCFSQSTPTRFLDCMDFGSTFTVHGDTTNQTDASYIHLNSDENPDTGEGAHLNYLIHPGSQTTWGMKKLYSSPLGKLWDGVASKSGSSDERGSLNSDLPCISEENENVDEAADACDEGLAAEVAVRRQPLADIAENENPPASTFAASSSRDSINTEFSFTGTSSRVKQSSNRRYKNNRKENLKSVTGVNCIKATGSLNTRFSKPKLSRQTSLEKGGPNFIERDPKSNNIVSNMTSFIPLVRQKQLAAVITGNREVKVKALEVADCAKRLAEKKDNDRRMKKQALKLERHLRQLELEKKRKEEERKKKEDDVVTRKRQREEDIKKERKRNRLEEVQRHQREHEEMLRSKKEEKQKKLQAKDENAPKRNLPKTKLEKLEKREAGHKKMSQMELMQDATSTSNVRKESIALEELESVLNYGARVVENDKSTIITGEPSYEISPYKVSDDEDEEDDDNIRHNKFIPSWASNVSMAIHSQKIVEPEKIFPPESFCNITEVLVPRELRLRLGH